MGNGSTCDHSPRATPAARSDRKSTRLNSSHSQISYFLFFFNDTAPTEIYSLSLHDALPICMNATGPWRDGQRVYMRSLATRDTGSEISAALPDVLAAAKVAGFDLVIVETSGIGQGDAAIVPLVDVPMYVMTPEFGAASQREKIDMLDFAKFVAIN